MTYGEFKDELYVIRLNRQVMRSIMADLRTYAEDQLSTVFSGAIDYSKERVQKTPDPDAAIINVIAKIDSDMERLKEKLERLEEENDKLETLIFKGEGLGGEFIRLYYIEGYSMNKIAERFNYSRQWTYTLWDNELKRLWREEFNKDE